jgi:hypothetical protein
VRAEKQRRKKIKKQTNKETEQINSKEKVKIKTVI